MSKAAPWPITSRLLLVVLSLLVYLAVFCHFQGFRHVRWHVRLAVPASSAILITDVTSTTSSAVPAAAHTAAPLEAGNNAADTPAGGPSAPAAGDSSRLPEEAAARAALAEAARQPVVIGLQRSGQWPFWQAIHAKQRIADLGVRASTHMQGPQMDAQHPDWHELNCTYQGIAINCVFTLNSSRFATADGMYFHTPGTPQVGDILPRQHPRQIRFAVSLESAAYYGWIDNLEYMCQFESEATYRSCSQVQATMHHETQHDFASDTNLVHLPELPYELKQDAVAYINSNCGSLSGRAQLMEQWMRLPAARAPVHAFGACSKNKPWPVDAQGRKLSKRQVFSRYKFCVAMENSISIDYITEKVWDALSAGCVPIYRGSPNVLSIMPEPQAVILYGPGGNASSVEQLDALVAAIMVDRVQYERMLAWKHRPLHELSPGYQRYLHMLQGGTNECRMCTHIVQRRLSGDFSRAITCLWNQTWLQQAGLPFSNFTCPGDGSASPASVT